MYRIEICIRGETPIKLAGLTEVAEFCRQEHIQTGDRIQ